MAKEEYWRCSKCGALFPTETPRYLVLAIEVKGDPFLRMNHGDTKSESYACEGCQEKIIAFATEAEVKKPAA